MEPTHDVIILGGGAAGLMCAARAGQRGRRVVVLERAEAVGKKILISGGGRCNFTNLAAAPDRYISANPHFAKSALARYTPRDFLELVESYGAFLEVYVSTPLSVCETRDFKGLYAKARAGLIKQVTGIDDPYEVPERPDVEIDTQAHAPDEAAQLIVLKLEGMGLIR